ncbi:S8 family peptidase [Thermomonospora cellulosilytica]|uniref:Type VII secretion-associated serine protease mycosin n=1 Tax=Thermomonospora cellulosilytica TaxID=1411118 RepID=A0A7W3MWF3_9ACTN|nr:S8 family serine peptidase [Thermomonospora cellulosilytica]MBA9003141.1 type VII secretion-associated serine protease mycosin [Thermomonospora cellulosilytica]
MLARRVAWCTTVLLAAQLTTTGMAAAAPSPSPTRTAKAKPTRSARPAPQPQRPRQQSNCQLEQGSPASQIQGEPWAQQRLGFTDVWQQTKGGGVTVAIVDSGVDTSHPQLRGKVAESVDVTGSGLQDCVGHGTEAAGIIAARDMRHQRIPFLGVAPGVKLISIKAAVGRTDNDPRWTAEGIRKAADMGAKVINVSSQTPNYRFLQEAVEYAQSKDALIVAAAGNIQDEQRGTATAAYPAAYEGVVSVGAIGPEGSLAQFSNAKTPVSVIAPGENIITTWPGGTYKSDSGTSFAAPYVAGVAALVRSYYPRLNYRQVKRRLELTADGGTVTGTGGGMVNPGYAVTAVLEGESRGVIPTTRPRTVSIARPEPEDAFTRNLALSVAGGALALAATAIAAGVVIPAGRRRGWRPTRRDPAS